MKVVAILLALAAATQAASVAAPLDLIDNLQVFKSNQCNKKLKKMNLHLTSKVK